VVALRVEHASVVAGKLAYEIDHGDRNDGDQERHGRLDQHVVAVRHRGQAQLAAPALHPFDGGLPAHAGGGGDGAVGGHGDHHVHRHVPVPDRLIGVGHRGAEDHVEERRQHADEEHGDEVAGDPTQFESGVSQVHRTSPSVALAGSVARAVPDVAFVEWPALSLGSFAPDPPSPDVSSEPAPEVSPEPAPEAFSPEPSPEVRAMNAWSRLPEAISRSVPPRSCSSARATASESLVRICTRPPLWSTWCTCSMASRRASASVPAGTLAETVRPVARVRISSVEPSATMCPPAISTMRLAKESASSR